MGAIDKLRQSLVNWYEFDKKSSVLLLGDSNGAILEYLSGKVKSVVTSMEEGATYDYVVVLNLIEVSSDPVASIKEWLAVINEGGKLLISTDNRYGLKYMLGAKDPYTGVCLDGVNGYLKGANEGRLYSSIELEGFIKEACDGSFKFYYPVPDSTMPQMIFTDSYSDGINARERLIDYNYAIPSMMGVEHRIFPDMISSGALKFNANSFFIEVCKGCSPSDIIYAVTTTDRGNTRGCATTIRESGYVYKRPLHEDGISNLKALADNTDYLVSKGVPVLPVTLEEDSCGAFLKMKRINRPGLTLVLDSIARENKERFLGIFDELYSYIGMTGDVVYLDIAPCNCFYMEDGSLLLYDQEFTKKDCPKLFAMYRTIKYCYASDRVLETIVPRQVLLDRYEITEDKIAEYEEMEKEFINSIRHKDDNSEIFAMATPNYDLIYKRIQAVSDITDKVTQKPYKVGYVPGVYDLFHKGHLRLFERCKARCDYLIVGVLTDDLVEFYKNKRPVISYEDRAEVIRGLSCVDEVIPVDFSNTDKLDAWNQLHYDCHFSGNDHANHWNDVWEELKKRGSNMEFFSYTEGISSTEIKNKMKG